MAIPSSGQSLAFSALRTEFVGGSSAVSLSDLYRGGSNIIKKAANNPATNLAASVATSGAIDTSDYFSQAKGLSFTYATGSITESNLSAQFGDDYAVDYPKVVTIPANTTLGADDPAEYGLEVDAGAAGTITITNSGTIVGSGGAGGGAGSANAGAGSNASAGGDAIKIASACTFVNNGSILAGAGGGAGGGGGGLGGNLQQQQQTTGQQGPTRVASSYNTMWATFYGPGAGPFGASPGPGGVWKANWSGTTVAQGKPYTGATSSTVGQYTYYKGSPTEQNDQNSPENSFQYNFGRSYIYRTFPQTSQNQVAGHNGGAGGAGGLGRGFQNLPAGDSGAAGASGSTGQAGNGGAGGAGGAGGGYGQAGASGSTGQAGVASTTGGASGGAGGSGGAAGLAVERASPISFNFTNNGTVAGTVQS